MSSVMRHGYLVLADITGYSSYLAGVELDHAHEILSDLLETVMGRLIPPLTFAKLELEYYTVAHTPQGRNATLTMTYRFTPTEQGGTHVSIVFHGKFGALPDMLAKWLSKLVINQNVKGRWLFEKIDSLVAQNARREESG